VSKQESDVVLNFKMNGEINYSRTIKDINKEMNLAATEYKNQVSAMDKNATQTDFSYSSRNNFVLCSAKDNCFSNFFFVAVNFSV
jgi:hypothetical protein